MTQTAFDADAATILFHEQMNLDLVGEKKTGYKNRMVTVKQWARKGEASHQLGVFEFAEKSKTMYSIEGSDITGFECVEDDEHFELKIFPEDGISLVKVQFNNDDQKFRFFRSLEQTFPTKLSRDKVKDAPRKPADKPLLKKKTKSGIFAKDEKNTTSRVTDPPSASREVVVPPASKTRGVDDAAGATPDYGRQRSTDAQCRDAPSQKGKGAGSGQGKGKGGKGGKGKGGKGNGLKSSPSKIAADVS